jgi:heme A synthase
MVLLVAMAVAMRVLAAPGADRSLRHLATALLAVVLAQVMLGVMSLILRGPSPGAAALAITTAHQLTGAVLLAVSTALMTLIHRLAPVPSVTGAAQTSTMGGRESAAVRYIHNEGSKT